MGMTQRYVPAMGEQCVDGIDTSLYQGPYDVGAAKRSGRADVVVIKTSEGNTINDPLFRRQAAAWRAQGTAPLGYHFARPDLSGGSIRNDANAEAERMVAIGREFGIDTFALDLEPVPAQLDPVDTGDWASFFQDRVDKLCPGRPHLFYTAPWVAKVPHLDWIRWGLWHASYPTNAIDPDVVGFRAPSINEPWASHGNFVAWQYTSMGRVDGIPGNVDRNVFTVRWYMALIHEREDIDMATSEELAQKLDATKAAVDSLAAGEFVTAIRTFNELAPRKVMRQDGDPAQYYLDSDAQGSPVRVHVPNPDVLAWLKKIGFVDTTEEYILNGNADAEETKHFLALPVVEWPARG